VPLSNRRALPLGLAITAAVLAPIAAAASGDDVRDPVPLPAGLVDTGDGQPRNRAAEAATGDIGAMRAVVQDIVDCLRAKGYHPGDPEVRGDSVLIGDWNPGWDSAAGRATHECTFPAS
jgi:hypothetical protein